MKVQIYKYAYQRQSISDKIHLLSTIRLFIYRFVQLVAARDLKKKFLKSFWQNFRYFCTDQFLFT